MNQPPHPLPRLLLVEDDPVSAVFLRDAAASLPAAVDVAGNLAEALAGAIARPHALYLIDANLPDGRGETLLLQLRERGLEFLVLWPSATSVPKISALHSTRPRMGFNSISMRT